MVGEPEVYVHKAALAHIRRQFGGDDVQEERVINVAGAAGGFDVRKRVIAHIHIKAGLCDGRAVIAGEDALVNGLRGGVGCQVKINAPLIAAGRRRVLPRADALYRVAGQLDPSYAYIALISAVVGELKVHVDKAELAACGGQVGGIYGKYVQQESSVGVRGRARRFEICQRLIVHIHIEVGSGDGQPVVAGEDAVVNGLRGGGGCHVQINAPISAGGRRRVLPRADALYRVAGQLARSHAYVARAQPVFGELETPIDKSALAAISGQFGGVDWKYVHK